MATSELKEAFVLTQSVIAVVSAVIGGLLVYLYLRGSFLTKDERHQLDQEQLNANKQILADSEGRVKSLTEELSTSKDERNAILIENAQKTVELGNAVRERDELKVKSDELEGERNDLANQLASIKSEFKSKSGLLERVEAGFSAAQSEIGRLTTENSSLKSDLNTEKATREQEKTSLNEQLKTLSDAEKKMTSVFQALANDVLQGSAKQFLVLANENFSAQHNKATGDIEQKSSEVQSIITPLAESVTRLRAFVEDIENQRNVAYGSINSQLESLLGVEKELKNETTRLVTALKTPVYKGRWGELQLKRVVEIAGMAEHCDFDEQVSVETEDGIRKPDMVIHLPNGRDIVIDSKVSLAAYMDAMNCDDDSARVIKLKEHAVKVKNHLKQLSSKEYWAQFDGVPEFVVAFLPGESFFSAALQYDPELIEFGALKKVVLATPTTLIALLKAIAYGWKQEAIAQSARQISDLGGQLFDRLVKISEHIESLRSSIEKSVSSFNSMVGSYESRVLVTARQFPQLGVGEQGKLQTIQQIETSPRRLLGISIEEQAKEEDSS